MGEQKEEIPLVDFDVFTDESQRDRVAQEIVNAFEKIGFVYLKYEHLANEAHAVFEMAKKFFHKPLEEKLLVKAGSNPRDLCGYHPTQTHGTLNNDLDADGNLKKLAKNEIKFDSKEMFQIFARDVFQFPNRWPEIPEFKETLLRFAEECKKANRALMRSIVSVLNKSNPDAEHQIPENFFDEISNPNVLRLLLYPTHLKNEVFIRAGAHTDYGTLTLLFQDDVGGLQVMNAEGKYFDVTPKEGTVVVNAGDMLQRWTNGKLKSTVHRVVSSTKELPGEYVPERYSIACFCSPHPDVVVQCLPGCEGESGPKYPPVTYAQYVIQRLQNHASYS